MEEVHCIIIMMMMNHVTDLEVHLNAINLARCTEFLTPL
jgi:hypothetical protein